MLSKQSIQDGLLVTVVLVLVFGSLALAVLDQTYRQPFADLSKIGISGLIGWMMPTSPPKRQARRSLRRFRLGV